MTVKITETPDGVRISWAKYQILNRFSIWCTAMFLGGIKIKSVEYDTKKKKIILHIF